MKKIAHCIHHTHWDLIWYFTAQDATVQFVYNMKELLEGFLSGKVDHFFLDGQTVPIDEYIRIHPEDKEYISELIKNEQLIIGPFHSQLDCFICNGESVINNLRLGIKKSNELGKSSPIAYLPDSFGHSYDFPKIFRLFGIENFVITRGVGDNYGLDSEFYMKSNDGSEILVCVMLSGYGYGCYAFKEGLLFENSATDYNKISVHSLIDRLLKYSTIENEFVFPLGFDQNPAIFNISKQIDYYNQIQDDILFKQTTWKEFCDHVRKHGKNLKKYEGELFSTQYHRLHKSIFSARADIKALQDKCERVLTYELQPLMCMLDSLGIPYDHGLIDNMWDTLLKCQTHSSATLTDETNHYIERETMNAYHLASSTKIYLMKLVSISLKKENHSMPLVVFNTLPVKRKQIIKMKILTKTPEFEIRDGTDVLTYTILKSIKKNNGVLRKDVALIDQNKFYYETDILLETSLFDGIGYKVYDIVEKENSHYDIVHQYNRFIENKRYQIYQDEEGIVIYDKKLHQKMPQALYLEESGDEGDSFDYSYPTHDYILTDDFSDANVKYYTSEHAQWMIIKGKMTIPYHLKNRKNKILDQQMPYEITITLNKNSNRINIKGVIHNSSLQHRVRFVVKGYTKHDYSYAGTQFSVIKRETHPQELEYWKEKQWFEEPSPTFPLLNHVSMIEKEKTISVFTRSSKEYELIGDDYQDLAITLFRSYGAMGYPDLHRRPGRPSGLDYMIFETPQCQMLKDNHFEFAIQYFESYDANQITNAYIDYACDILYYQKQDFDKSIHPISYFPTNKWKYDLPDEYQFFVIEDSTVNFGSIVQSDISNGYILRLYNSKENDISGGIIKSDVIQDIYLTDLLESEKKEISCQLPLMKKGELRIIYFNLL